MLPSPSKSPRDRAATIFNLFRPIKSSKWPKYITQRREAEKIKNVVMSTDTVPPDESHSYLLTIKHAVERAVSVHNIAPHEQMGIADSIAVTCCQVLGDPQGVCIIFHSLNCHSTFSTITDHPRRQCHISYPLLVCPIFRRCPLGVPPSP